MLKVDILIVRKSGTTYADFLTYWRDSHAAFFSSQPIVKKTVRRYVQSRLVPIPKTMPVAPYDGIAQLWFADMAGFTEYIESSNYQDVIRIDEAKFVDPAKVQLIFSEETEIFPQQA